MWMTGFQVGHSFWSLRDHCSPSEGFILSANPLSPYLPPSLTGPHPQFSDSSTKACIVYLFPEWPLTTAVKFAFACIGTFLMGIVVVSLGTARKAVWLIHETKPNATPLTNAGLMAALVALYAVQLTLGYFIMLFVMTYQAELFIMSVMGLTTGHFVFDVYGRFYSKRSGADEVVTAIAGGAADACTKNIDPCCVE